MRSNAMKTCAAGAMLFGGTLGATQAVAGTVVIDDFGSDGSLTEIRQYNVDATPYWLPSGVFNLSADWNTSSWTTDSSFQGRRQLWSSMRQGYQVGSYNPETYSYEIALLNNNHDGAGVAGGAFNVKTFNPSLQGSPWVGGSTVTIGTQYFFDSPMDLTGMTQLVLRGSGSGIGQPTGLGTGGLSVSIELFTGASDVDGTFTSRSGSRFTFEGVQSFGDFEFNLASLTPVSPGSVDLASVNAIMITFESYNGTGGGLGASGWDYTMTGIELVPAPGAIALLGAAGLIGARRRRD